MRKLILLVLLVFAMLQGIAQQKGISYQAVILNPEALEIPGQNVQTSVLANRQIAIQFTILDEANNEEYKEYHITTTDSYGMISLLIGMGTSQSSNTFDNIVWAGFNKTIQIGIDYSVAANNFTYLGVQNISYMPQPPSDETLQLITANTEIIVSNYTEITNANHTGDVIGSTELTIVDNRVTDAKVAMGISASKVGLENVDNTTDANKPVSTATQSALNLKGNLASPTFTGTPTLPTGAIAITQTAGNNTTKLATTAFVTSAVSTATIPDATTSVKGKVQLTGDLAGTADFPRIDSVDQSTAVEVSQATVLANAATDANTANQIVKRDASGDFTAGIITASIEGNISGTAANVTATVAIANGGTGETSKATAFDALSPLSTEGDILYAGASGTDIRLAKGSAGQVLKMNSEASAPEWGESIAVPDGTANGEVRFWDGTNWVALAPPTSGVNNALIFDMSTSKPAWTEITASSILTTAATVANSTIGVSPSTVVADGSSTSTITLQAKDANNNNITSGGLTIVFTSTGSAALQGLVVDNNNGTYTQTITSTVAEGVTISATIGGSGVTSGNPTITFTGG